MSETITLVAEKREDVGKGASRRLRKTSKIPAIIYGGTKDPVQVSFEVKDVKKAMEEEAFFSQILTIELGGKKEKSILKDIQRHPAKDSVMHMDFQRIDASFQISTSIPLHYINENVCLGVKAGGAISHHMVEIEIRCLPKDLPQFIEIDVANLNKGDSLHLSDLKLPEDVKIPALAQGKEHDQVVVSVHAIKATAAEDDETATESSPEAAETAAKSQPAKAGDKGDKKGK